MIPDLQPVEARHLVMVLGCGRHSRVRTGSITGQHHQEGGEELRIFFEQVFHSYGESNLEAKWAELERDGLPRRRLRVATFSLYSQLLSYVMMATAIISVKPILFKRDSQLKVSKEKAAENRAALIQAAGLLFRGQGGEASTCLGDDGRDRTAGSVRADHVPFDSRA